MALLFCSPDDAFVLLGVFIYTSPNFATKSSICSGFHTFKRVPNFTGFGNVPFLTHRHTVARDMPNMVMMSALW
jgi:hypothetical protein